MTDDSTSPAPAGTSAPVDRGPDAGETAPVNPPAGSPGPDPALEPARTEAPRTDHKPGVVPPVVPIHRPSMIFLVVVSVVSLVADLGTKWWAKERLEDPRVIGGRRIEVIEDVFGFIFAKNRGGAWGLLQDESEAVRRPFFLLISAAAILFIVTLYRRVTPQQTALKWGLPLVLGGAIGNLVDRIRYGYVIDFIDIHITRDFRWPTFNVADIAICVGVGLMAIDMFTSRKPEPQAGSAVELKDASTGAKALPAGAAAGAGIVSFDDTTVRTQVEGGDDSEAAEKSPVAEAAAKSAATEAAAKRAAAEAAAKSAAAEADAKSAAVETDAAVKAAEKSAAVEANEKSDGAVEAPRAEAETGAEAPHAAASDDKKDLPKAPIPPESA